MDRQHSLLRTAFLVGALTDAVALIPMLSPSAARLLWGLEPTAGPYTFAMGYGAALMSGWTALLLWAYQRPLERRFIAPLTAFVICGLIGTEFFSIASGYATATNMLVTLFVQAILLSLLAIAYHYGTVQRWLRAPS